MRQTYTYRAFNARHSPMQSADFSDCDSAVSWAADAAAVSLYHSEVSVTCKSLPDAEYGDHVIDTHTNVLGVVMSGSRELLRKVDGVDYPQNA